MEEVEEIKLAINVRELISVYENKSANPEVPQFRPRAKSLGNLLAKDVTVKTNEFKTLSEVQGTIQTIDQDLTNYEVYNKAKHVQFQEQLFNILTSIINIDNDDPNKARSLITKTKNLVTILNNKLPSNNIVQSRYIPYASVQKEFNSSTTTSSNSILTKTINYQEDNSSAINNTKHENEIPIVSSEADRSHEVEDELEDLTKVVSVSKLKEKFQPVRNETTIQSKIKKTESIKKKSFPVKVIKTVSVETNTVPVKTDINNTEILQNNIKDSTTISEPQVQDSPPIDSTVQISVTNLRNIFEIKGKEGSAGLPVILKQEKPPITRFNYKSNFNEEPSLEVTHSIQNKETSPLEAIESYTTTSRLLALLKRDQEHLQQEFKSEEDDVTPTYNMQNYDFDRLEHIEEGVSDEDVLSDDSNESVESVKLVNRRSFEDFNEYKVNGVIEGANTNYIEEKTEANIETSSTEENYHTENNIKAEENTEKEFQIAKSINIDSNLSVLDINDDNTETKSDTLSTDDSFHTAYSIENGVNDDQTETNNSRNAVNSITTNNFLKYTEDDIVDFQTPAELINKDINVAHFEEDTNQNYSDCDSEDSLNETTRKYTIQENINNTEHEDDNINNNSDSDSEDSLNETTRKYVVQEKYSDDENAKNDSVNKTKIKVIPVDDFDRLYESGDSLEIEEMNDEEANIKSGSSSGDSFATAQDPMDLDNFENGER